jgi:hypothetical protein
MFPVRDMAWTVGTWQCGLPAPAAYSRPLSRFRGVFLLGVVVAVPPQNGTAFLTYD